MKQSKTLIDQLSKDLRTQAGPTTSTSRPASRAESAPAENKLTSAQKQELSSAINGVFTLLHDAFPTKYKHAFRTVEDERRAQGVWMASLKVFPPVHIVEVTKRAIKTTKYFPDLAEIYQLCRSNFSDIGLKEPLLAYYEACNAQPQDLSYPWSHKAVYLAARDTGWMMLRGEEQRRVFPIFEQHYERLCQQVLQGTDLDAQVENAIEDANKHSGMRKALAFADQQQQERMQSQGIDPKAGRTAFLKLKDSL